MHPAEFSFQNIRFGKIGNGPSFLFDLRSFGGFFLFLSPGCFWFPVSALLGKWEGFPRNANCVRHLPLPPPYRSDQYHGLCQSFCCYSTTVALPSIQSMPLFFLLHIYLHLNLFFLVAFVEVAIMSVVRGGRQQQQTIWNVDTSFSLVIISVFFIFQGWKRDVKDMVL